MGDAERRATGDGPRRKPPAAASSSVSGPGVGGFGAAGRHRRTPRRRWTAGFADGAARLAAAPNAAAAAWRWLAACLAADREAGRGFLWLPVGFVGGIGLYFSLADEPSLPVLAAIAAAAVVIAVLVRVRPVAGPMALLVAAVAAGACAAKLELVAAAAPVLDRPRTETVTGFVEAVERRPRGRIRLTVRVVAADVAARLVGGAAPGRTSATAGLRRVVVTAAAAPVPRRLPAGRLAAAGEGEAAGAAPIAVGEGVSFRARLAPPRAPILPGGYDAARAAMFEGVGATGFVYGRVSVVDLGPPPWPLRLAAAVATVRAGTAERIRRALPGDTGEVAAALLVGERGGIPERIEEEMRISGLAHVLSISGLHMALVAGTVFAIVRAALAAVPGLALTRPIKSWAAVAAAVAATAYLVISGAEVATQRAYVTILVTLAAVVVGRPAISLRTVAVAALVVTTLSPSAVLGAGYQMSFAAVVALVAVYEALSIRRVMGDPPDGWIARLGRAALIGLAGLALTSLVAGLATAPIAAYHFHRGAPLGLLANLLAMPAVSVLVMPFGVAALALMPLHLESLALVPMGLGIEAMLAVAGWVASLTGGGALVGRVPAAAPLLLVAALLWAAITVAPWRMLALGPLAAGLLLLPAAAPADLVVSGDGRTVAVRGEGGRLAAVSRGPDGDFVLRAWLAAEADDRPPDDPSLAAGVRCDALGCTASLQPAAAPPPAARPTVAEGFPTDRLAPEGIASGGIASGMMAVAAGAPVANADDPNEDEPNAAPLKAVPPNAAPTSAAAPDAAEPTRVVPTRAAPVEVAQVEVAQVEAAPVRAAPVVAVAREPAALLDDCRVAAVVVAPVARPPGCDVPRLYLGPPDLRGGAVVVRWPDGIEGAPEVTAARPPGWRPWYGPAPAAPAAAQ